MSLEEKENTEPLEEITEKKGIETVTVKKKMGLEPVEVVGIKGRLLGKVAVVTGAASGIGRGIAHRFALEGAKISVVDLNLEGAKKVVKEIKNIGGKVIEVECNIGDEDQISKAVRETEKKLGTIDILVNNAAIYNTSLAQDMTTESWRNMFKTNTEGTFYFSRAVLKSMKAGSRIINIASISALTGDTGLSHYAASKAAVIGFTKSLALEVAHRGITVNAIAPGFIYTPLIKDVADTVASELYKDIPVKRIGQPEDIAEAAAYLASPGAGYITGQVIVVDGGLSMMNPGQQLIHKMLGL